MVYRAKVDIEETQGASKRIRTVDVQIISDTPVSDMEFARAALEQIEKMPGADYKAVKVKR